MTKKAPVAPEEREPTTDDKLWILSHMYVQLSKMGEDSDIQEWPEKFQKEYAQMVFDLLKTVRVKMYVCDLEQGYLP